MSSSIPEGWAEIKLGQIVKLQGGNSFKSSDFKEKGIPIVRISNIQNNIVDLSSAVYFEESKHFENFLISNGDILLAMSGATTGKIGRYRYPFKSYLNQRVGKFQIIKNSLIDSDFLNHLVHSNIFTKNTMIDAIGGAQPNISSTQVEGVFYSIPPLPEQKKIASILTSVDEVIENTQKQIDKLQDLKKATMNELLTKGISHTEFKDSELGRIPKSWSLKKLGDLSNIFFSNVDKKTDENETEVLLCNYMDVYSNRNIDKRIEFMQATAKKREIDKFKISKGDVLITKDSETPADIAIPSYVSEELHNVLCGYHLALIRPHRNNLSGKFLYYLFSFDKIQHRYYQLANGTTRFGLTAEIITDTPLPIPPLIEQKEIATIIISVDQKIEILEKKMQQTQSLKKSLMQDLLTGKVRVSVN